MTNGLIDKIRKENKKIILAGGAVGKTTLMHRYIEEKFKSDTKMTGGVEFFKKSIDIDNETINFIFWDLAGQDRWRFFQSDLCKGADGAILAFDLTSYSTYSNIEQWVNILRSWDLNLPIIFIGMKNDLTNRICVDDEHALKFKEQYDLYDYIKVSSKTGENVDELFNILFDYILNREKYEKKRTAIEIKLKEKIPKVEQLIQGKKFLDAEIMLEEISNTAKKYKIDNIIKWTLQKMYPSIEQFIQDKKYIKAERELERLINTAQLYNFLEIIKWALEKKLLIIELLIYDEKYIETEQKLEKIKNTAKQHNFPKIFKSANQKIALCYRLKNKKKIDTIKKTILDLGTKFGRLQIMEISEVCSIVDEQLIIDIVKEMINNKEIYAQYFSSTKAIAFDQQANIDEIDNLMKAYREWEEKEVGKK